MRLALAPWGTARNRKGDLRSFRLTARGLGLVVQGELVARLFSSVMRRQVGDHRRGLVYGDHGRGKRSLNGLRHSAAEQFMLIDLVVNAVEIRASNDLAGVQERNALALCDVSITLAEEKRLFLAALEHLRVVGKLGDRGRRDQKDFWWAGVRTLAIGASEEDEARCRFGDVEGGNGEPLLQVVAAKREDNEIDGEWLMRQGGSASAPQR